MSAEPDARDDPRDPQLAGWYREGGGPEPSPALDEAILAAAHREVGARPRAAGFPLRRWRVPLSLAAAVVLSVTVVTLVREERGDLAEMGAPPAALPAARAPAATEAERPPVEAGTQGGRSTAQQLAAPEAPDARVPKVATTSPSAPKASVPQAPSPAPLGRVMQPPSPLKDAARQPAPAERAPVEPYPGAPPTPDAVTGNVPAAAPRSEPAADRGEGEDARRAAGPRDDAARAAAPPKRAEAQEQAVAPGAAATTAKSAAAPLASPPAAVRRESAPAESRSLARLQAPQAPAPSGSEVAQLLKELDKQPPERWLEKIEELRRAGRQAESDELLAAFRKRFPEHPVPAAR